MWEVCEWSWRSQPRIKDLMVRSRTDCYWVIFLTQSSRRLFSQKMIGGRKGPLVPGVQIFTDIEGQLTSGEIVYIFFVPLLF